MAVAQMIESQDVDVGGVVQGCAQVPFTTFEPLAYAATARSGPRSRSER